MTVTERTAAVGAEPASTAEPDGTNPDPAPRGRRVGRRWVGLLGGLLVLGAAACSSGDTPPPPPAAVTTIPPGTYANPVTPSGPQTLTIDAGTSYTQTISAIQLSIPGTISQDSSRRVTFTSTGGAPCAGQTGVYRANVDASGLHLVADNDPCPRRADDFASGTWTLR